MFQNKHFNPNYTRIREKGEDAGWGRWGDLVSQYIPLFGITFSQAKIC